jgi:hypothetical protein
MITIIERPEMIIIEYRGKTVTDLEQKTVLEDVARLIKRNNKVVSILSDTGDTELTGIQRKMSAEWFKDGGIIPLIKSFAVVIHSAIQRGLVTAIIWLAPKLPIPVKIFNDVASATKWIKERK